jgi:flagellar motor switch protein FliG
MPLSPHEPLRKAAVLLAALDRPAADALLAQMSPAEAERVRQAVIELGPFETAEQDAVLAEFVELAPAPNRTGGVEWVDSTSLPEIAPDAPAASPFAFLRAADADVLVPLLKHEHPQTLALVLAHLPPDRAAPVLTALPAAAQQEVLRRLAESDDAHPPWQRGSENWIGGSAGGRPASARWRRFWPPRGN